MKLSLLWILDHIQEMAGTRTLSTECAEKIITRLGASTAEIDALEHISIDLTTWELTQCIRIDSLSAFVYSPETGKEYTLPFRQDALVDHWYLVIRAQPDQYQWASVSDMHADKEGLVPAVSVNKSERTGGWKKSCDIRDVRITIDNKAITHRPDLWSHRGFAREVAALCGWHLRPLQDMIRTCTIHETPTTQFDISSPTVTRFSCAAVSISDVAATQPWMAFRLAKVESRPINLIVDATNYVLFDLGQPMHAFDADRIEGSKLIARQAHTGEQIQLLDGTNIELVPEDCVIADAQGPLSLAGIKGGMRSAVSNSTRNLMLESAHFNPHLIRHSSRKHHIRTESSARFEKSLDAAGITDALQRYLFLLAPVTTTPCPKISVAGTVPDPRCIAVSLANMSSILGITMTAQECTTLLKALGFCVIPHTEEEFEIQVPSFRLQDIHCLEDIAEEVARMKGYDTFPRTLPHRVMSCASSEEQEIIRSVKHHLAYAERMQELISYPFYDEPWLQTVGLTELETLTVQNPVSDHMKRLVTSLIPQLLKAIPQNALEEPELGFFEMNRVWIPTSNTTYHEQNSLALLLYARKRALDFYEMKQKISSLLEMLRLPLVWKPATTDLAPWYLLSESAHVWYEEHHVGTIGKINPTLLAQCAEGIAYAAELNMSFIATYKTPSFTYHPISKFQPIRWDISILAPHTLTVEHIQNSIRAVDSRITQVMLKDMFEKPEWKQRRSLTFHVVAIDHTHTLTGPEIDDLMNRVAITVQQSGGELR